MAKDWIGNSKATYATIGASNHSKSEREEHDFYATDNRGDEIKCGTVFHTKAVKTQ